MSVLSGCPESLAKSFSFCYVAEIFNVADLKVFLLRVHVARTDVAPLYALAAGFTVALPVLLLAVALPTTLPVLVVTVHTAFGVAIKEILVVDFTAALVLPTAGVGAAMRT